MQGLKAGLILLGVFAAEALFCQPARTTSLSRSTSFPRRLGVVWSTDSELADEGEAGVAIEVADGSLDAEVSSVSSSQAGKGARNRRASKKDATPLSELEVGKTYEGTVTGVTSYGCFVDIGAQSDGLAHISELSTGFVEDVNSVVEVGQAVQARILSVDLEKRQLSLSLKSEAEAAAASSARPRRERRPQRPKRAGPDELRKYLNSDPAEFIDGTVVSIKPFGAFVNIEDGVDGLVHISQISDERTENVEDVLAVGQPVKVRIIEVDLERVTIGLSMAPYVDAKVASALDTDSTNLPSSGQRPGRRQTSAQATDDNDDRPPWTGRPSKFKASRRDGDEVEDDVSLDDTSAPRVNKPKRMDPGDDIWDTKPHEQFDWQAAMAEVHQNEEAIESGIAVDPTTGKLTLQ